MSHLWEPAQPQHSLSNLLAPSPVPLCFSGSSLSSHAGLSPSTAGPLPWKISANPANAIPLPVCFVGPQFWQLKKVLFSRENSAHLVKTCPTPARDQTLPTISTESLCRKLGCENKAKTRQQSTLNTHTQRRQSLKCPSE